MWKYRNPHLRVQSKSSFNLREANAMSRLTIDITEQQHQSLKALAALAGKTIKQYALERLLPSDEEQAMQELKALLLERLAEAERGEVSPLNAVEIAEEVMREARAA